MIGGACVMRRSQCDRRGQCDRRSLCNEEEPV